MGFLRAFNIKSWNEVNRQLQLFDQRISGIEGVHGNYNPKADINSGNVTTSKNLIAPTNSTDAARYSDSLRIRSYSFRIGGHPQNSTPTLDYPLIPNYSYWLGAGNNGCYTVPCDMKFHKLWLFAGESLVPFANDWLRADMFAGGNPAAPMSQMATIHLWARGVAAAWYGTYTASASSRATLPRGSSLFFRIVTQPGPCSWSNANLIADFLTVDK